MMGHDQKFKQAGTEVGQAQHKLELGFTSTLLERVNILLAHLQIC